MKNNNILLFITNAVSFVFYLLIGIMIIFVAFSKMTGDQPVLFGYQVKTVLSGSMEPGIQTGSIIAVKTGGDPLKYKEKDVVTYMMNSHQLVTHRIVEVIKKNDNIMYRTKGDNNDGPDTSLLLPKNIVAEYKGLTIPYVGYFIDFTRSKNGIFLLFFLPGMLLICQSAYQVTGIIIDEKEKNNLSVNGEDVPNTG
ncbi:signal peptidase I SipW [Jeotgalibacillus sp. S-D1]|uniref:signal peptidase I SipW n=1 Tax=Jeotgalibacillus sp. S-D1 TaxID=2552189 RepID=UPI001404A751|nr:signal peptidase I [Jeotgalibacillus sp. S-D1]